MKRRHRPISTGRSSVPRRYVVTAVACRRRPFSTRICCFSSGGERRGLAAPLGVRALELLGRRRGAGGRKRRQPREPCRVSLDHRCEIVVLGPPERPPFLWREHAVARRADVGQHLPADARLVELLEAHLDVEPPTLRRPRTAALAQQLDDVRADPVRVKVDERGGRRGCLRVERGASREQASPLPAIPKSPLRGHRLPPGIVPPQLR